MRRILVIATLACAALCASVGSAAPPPEVVAATPQDTALQTYGLPHGAFDALPAPQFRDLLARCGTTDNCEGKYTFSRITVDTNVRAPAVARDVQVSALFVLERRARVRAGMPHGDPPRRIV